MTFLSKSVLCVAALSAALFMMSPTPSFAVEPDEILSDPVLEKRARDIGRQLRCVVCQNQAIDDSNAELARDMRILVRDRIVRGDSDLEVLDYMVGRYGDYVLLDPPFKSSTVVLWVGPSVIALLGIFWVVSFYRRRAGESVEAGTGAPLAAASSGLSAEEQKRLEKLLAETDSQKDQT